MKIETEKILQSLKDSRANPRPWLSTSGLYKLASHFWVLSLIIQPEKETLKWD